MKREQRMVHDMPELDDDGFLVDARKWTEEVAEILAQDEVPTGLTDGYFLRSISGMSLLALGARSTITGTRSGYVLRIFSLSWHRFSAFEGHRKFLTLQFCSWPKVLPYGVVSLNVFPGIVVFQLVTL